MAGFSPYGALPRKLGLLSMWGDPNSAATMPAGVRGLLAGKVAPAQDDEEADAPAANASPAGPAPMNIAPQGMLGVPADVPLPPPRPAEFGGQAQAAQPSAASPEKTGFDGFLDKLGNIYGSGGPGDPLITLGLSLMGEGDIGTRVQRGMEAMSKQKLLSAQGDLQKNKLAGQNATAKLISERMNIPLDQAMGLVSSGGANTVLGQIFQNRAPQLVDVPQPDGSTQKQWITPGQDGGVSVGAAKPTAETQTSDMKNYEAAKKEGFTGTLMDYQAQTKKPLVDMSTKGNEALNKNIIDDIQASKKNAMGAYSTLQAIARQRDALDNGMVTGWGADWATNGRNMIATMLGIDDPKVINSQAFDAAAKQKGAELAKSISNAGHTTNADLLIGQAIAGGDRSKMEQAIRAIVDAQEYLAKDSIKRHNEGVDKFAKIMPDAAGAAEWYRIKEPDLSGMPKINQGKPKARPTWRIVP